MANKQTSLGLIKKILKIRNSFLVCLGTFDEHLTYFSLISILRAVFEIFNNKFKNFKGQIKSE